MTTQIETKKKVNRIQTLSPFEMHNGIASDPQFTVDELREQHIGPNRKDALAAAAIPKEGKCFGYAGKILYVDLTDGSAKTIPSSTYLPKWIGGVSLAFKMFYDDVPASAKAFDPENEVIFASGPTTATGLPTSSRAEFVSINPHSIPEQISWSGIGGHMSVQMKFAGYDAVAIRGKADQPVILFVDDDKVTLVDATECWGKLIHDSLDWIRETLGDDVECCAIGPAGEKLCRDACVTTRTDNTASKSGLGAVFGSKNLKGLAFRGTKAIKPYDTEKVFSLRRTVAQPKYQPAPVTHDDVPETVGYLEGLDKSVASVEGGVLNGRLACGYGCSMRCNKVILNSTSVFTGKQIAQMDKCCTQFSWDNRHDELAAPFADPVGAAGNVANSMSYPTDLSQMDFTDPALLATAAQLTPGDSYDWPIYGWNKGRIVDQYCQEYGIDKWDTLVWYFSWLSMASREGLFDGIDFGTEFDLTKDEFIEHCMKIYVDRTGPEVTLADGTKRPLGDVFAEGVGRAIRALGEEKYGHSIFHGRRSNVLNKRLDIPVSLEMGWGTSSHWGGRGWQGCPKSAWSKHALKWMLSTRDVVSNGHAHDKMENVNRYASDPFHSTLMLQGLFHNTRASYLKDSVVSCEWAAPDLYWPEMEPAMFTAATGIACTRDDLETAADRAELIFRAILIRNFGRDRNLEVNEIYPFVSFPDPHGENATWEEWNDGVDLLYTAHGWDLQTGWPIREAWEAVGLADVADEMEALGKLPDSEGSRTYVRAENTTWRRGVKNGDGVYEK